MKLFCSVVVSTLFSVNAFAASLFSEGANTNEPATACRSYLGTGSMYYTSAGDQAINYTVALNVVSLGDGSRDLLDYNLMINGQTMRWAMIIDDKENDVFQKVLIPSSAAKIDDYTSYIETGWAHKIEYDSIHRDEGTPKKRTMLFNFLDQHGNRVTHHMLAYRIDGKWQLISTGSIGNTDGVISVWAHKLSQADSCQL